MLKRKKFLIGGIIVALAINSLAYTGFQSSATYYYTVSEITGQDNSIYGENVKVNGLVASGSVESNLSDLTLKFTIAEAGDSLPVVFHGVTPDNFKVGNEIVIEGYLDSTGVFHADSILTKCPSKYVPEE